MGYRIIAKVEAREFVPQTTRTIVWEEEAVIEYETPTKQALLNKMRSTFGRCTGVIPMGYSFEGVILCDDGTKTWWETRVTLGGDVAPVRGFNLASPGK
jgi:hypothetical protein